MTELEVTRLKLKALEMVEGTNLLWSDVIRHKATKEKKWSLFTGYILAYDLDDVELALGIVEGRPVWFGDTIWHSHYGEIILGVSTVLLAKDNAHCFSWNQAKPKTVMVELPIRLAQCYADNSHGAAYELSDACRKALKID